MSGMKGTRTANEIAVAVALDLDGEESIKRVVEEYGKDGLIVVQLAPGADSAELYAETVVHSDPSWAGLLSGVAPGLPVYHIMETEIKALIDNAVYQEHLGLMRIALDNLLFSFLPFSDHVIS